MVGKVLAIKQALYHISNMTRPPLNEIFKCLYKKLKEKGMYEVHPQYGYTLKEIAAYIGLHYT